MTTHPSPPQANAPALPPVPVALDPGPTAECLVKRRDQLTQFLRRRGFSGYVIERAIDRVIQAALPHIRGDGTTVLPLRNRLSWLFGSALKAARQEASRQAPCVFLEPAALVDALDREPDPALQEKVQNALAQLTALQREAVELCDMRGMTLAEAAAEMGCIRTTVLHHRKKGLELLRLLLATDRSA